MIPVCGSPAKGPLLTAALTGYLLCKNSWGSNWGLKGTFKIAYGAAFILQPDYTFAIEFRNNSRPQQAAALLNEHSVRVT